MGRDGCYRTHLGPWLSHSTALSLGFQIRQVKGRDQLVAKMTLCDLGNQDQEGYARVHRHQSSSELTAEGIPERPPVGPGLMEKGLCLKVLASSELTQAEQGCRHPQNRKHNATPGSVPRPLPSGARGDGEEALPVLWVKATRASYVPICCRW